MHHFIFLESEGFKVDHCTSSSKFYHESYNHDDQDKEEILEQFKFSKVEAIWISFDETADKR